MFPATRSARDRFVLDRRGPRPRHHPWRFQHVLVETEPLADLSVVNVATVFLTGRECPWRCVMCDLWRGTIETDTPAGAIPTQIVAALRTAEVRQASIRHVKLYNAASFFDPRAVPECDYDTIANHLAALDRLIVESHPAMIGPRVERFVESLDRHGSATLEVAMGLETAHPQALERLNKGMTLPLFERAANRLVRSAIGLRVFLLIAPPFVPAAQQDVWLQRSID